MGSFGFPILMMSLCLMTMILFLGLLLIPLCWTRTPESRVIFATQKYGAIICMLLAILCTILDIAHSSSAIPVDILINDPSFSGVTTMADLCYFSSSLLLYIIFFHRIYKSFTNTMYEVSQQYLVFFNIIIAVYTIFILIYVLLVATNQLTGFIYFALFMLIELIISVALLVEFIHKLRQIILNQIDADLYQYVSEPVTTVHAEDGDAVELGTIFRINLNIF